MVVRLSRPLYETPADAVLEDKAAFAFANYYGLKPQKRPPQDFLDYNLVGPFSQRILVAVEIKIRKLEYKNLIEKGGYMLSAKKWESLQEENQKVGLAVLVVAFKGEGIYSLPFGQRDYNDIEPVMGGRTKKQRDEQDVEPVVYIPWDRFTRVI